MKPYFKRPVGSLKQAHNFLRQLHEDDLLFHPEDDPESVINQKGEPLFTIQEVKYLRRRISEVYDFDSDPCAFCIDLNNGEKA